MNTVAKLLQRAKSATSLEDFGEDSFHEGLEILVASAEKEAPLTERGRAAFESQIVDTLCNRLQIEHWYRLHPEIDEEQIVAPLIGLGLPRTGSTALSNLLAQDQKARSLRSWEAVEPCPPPETATEHDDPRIARSQLMLDRRNKSFPRMMMMLPSAATAPTECQTFMGYDFKSQLFQALIHVPSYTQWLNHKADLLPTYRYVKRILKLLQWHCPPKRWRLKNPTHSLFIGALSATFPDARFWMTHRDVANVIPSVADLYYELRKASSDTQDKKYLGQMTTDFCELGMRRMMAFRDAGNDKRFFDIYFAPFQKDPYPILAQLYEFLGEEFTPQTRERMQAWRQAMPRDKHGEHHYDPAAFGIDPAQLRQRFAFYSQRFSGVLTP